MRSPGTAQTTALDVLTVGATGSYGTSSEPCNYRAKFPEVGIVMAHYLAGETLPRGVLESVQMPGQGVFVGDPLACLFGGVRVSRTPPRSTVIETRALAPGNYFVEASKNSFGPFQAVAAVRASRLRDSQDHVAGGEYMCIRVADGNPLEAPKGRREDRRPRGSSTLQVSAGT